MSYCNKSWRVEQIIKLVAAGLTNKEIANELGLSKRGVTYWMQQIYLKLPVRTRTKGEMVAVGFRSGLLR